MEISVCMLVVVCMYVVFLCIKEHLLSVLRALGGAPPCPICPFFLFSSFSFCRIAPESDLQVCVSHVFFTLLLSTLFDAHVLSSLLHLDTQTP